MINRRLLAFINPFVLIISTLIGYAIMTAVYSLQIPQVFIPDPFIYLIIWIAIRRSFYEGSFLVLVPGYIVEVLRAAPQGIYMAEFVLLFLGLHTANLFVLIMPDSKLFRVTFISTIFSEIILSSLLKFMNIDNFSVSSVFFHWVPWAAFQSLYGYWVYRWLKKLDWATFKDIRRQKLLDSENYLAVEDF